jgi:hypothetical protein
LQESRTLVLEYLSLVARAEVVLKEYHFLKEYSSYGMKIAKKGAKDTAGGEPSVMEEEFIWLVFKEHMRPNLSRIRAPSSIKVLLQMCWCSNPESRWDMALTNSTLRKELVLLRKGDESPV